MYVGMCCIKKKRKKGSERYSLSGDAVTTEDLLEVRLRTLLTLRTLRLVRHTFPRSESVVSWGE